MNLLVQLVVLSSILNVTSGLNCYGCTNELDGLSCGKEYVKCPWDVSFCSKLIVTTLGKTTVTRSCTPRATSDHLEGVSCSNSTQLQANEFFGKLMDMTGGDLKFEMICICDTDAWNGSKILKPNLFIFLGVVGFFCIW